ncbi:MAG: DUF1192 domain-containing protein [Hyphomonadaceae bacterium]|nr:DUF1192 domain-containing protein [Hyphomonadaceae bacterium]
MIDDDPFAPPAKKPAPLEAQLETASIEELEARIGRLRLEIAQCEQAIASKRAQRAAADSVFGPRSA